MGSADKSDPWKYPFPFLLYNRPPVAPTQVSSEEPQKLSPTEDLGSYIQKLIKTVH